MTEPRRIEVVPYSTAWADEFEQERATLMRAIGGITSDIRHVGSTSIPGMAAKPTIDIAVGLTRFDDGLRCVAPLQQLGYEYRGENGIVGRHYFDKQSPNPRHLHMYAKSDLRLLDYTLFRDYLTTHADTAGAYVGLKRGLAQQFSDDRVAYTDGKAAFIVSILEKARAER
jgi:GrpB-like predicted nucleotidyltransferase (UPF0157 family)